MFQSKLLLAAAGCLSIALAGCGGGGGGTPASSTASPSGSTGGTRTPAAALTTPVKVLGLDVIHVEMTDVSNLSAKPQLHGEAVCPGVPPRGNECTVTYLDGTSALHDAAYHAQALTDMTPWTADLYYYWEPGGWRDHWKAAGINLFAGFTGPYPGDNRRRPAAIGGSGEYSLAYFHYRMHVPSFDSEDEPRWKYGYSAAAMGELHAGRPAGSATYRGPVFSTYTAAVANAGDYLLGDSIIVYHAATNTVDVEIYPLGYDWDYPQRLHGSDVNYFSWTDLPVNSDASFYIPGYGNDESGTDLHPELGYIDGDFYGPNAGETAGVFERQIPEEWGPFRAIGDPGEGQTIRGGWLAIKDAAPY